ncbi:hypothetical protein BGX33_006751 [Mortierella sp. NVP41]|nr:hypothetical protein BGX33_006751 [Mortierella sp. NVP41]
MNRRKMTRLLRDKVADPDTDTALQYTHRKNCGDPLTLKNHNTYISSSRTRPDTADTNSPLMQDTTSAVMDPGGSSPPLGKKVRRSFEVRNTAMSAYVHGMQVSPAQLSVEESVAVREACESGTAAATLVRFYTGRSLDSDRSTPGWNNLSIDRATFIDGKSLSYAHANQVMVTTSAFLNRYAALLDDLQENWDDDAVLDQIENLQAQAVEGGRRQHKFPDGAGSLPIITETDEDCQEREVDLDDWSSSEAESEFDPEETQDYIEDEDESDDTPAHYLNRNNQDDKY